MTRNALTFILAACAASAVWLCVQLDQLNADAQTRIDAARAERAQLLADCDTFDCWE